MIVGVAGCKPLLSRRGRFGAEGCSSFPKDVEGLLDDSGDCDRRRRRVAAGVFGCDAFGASSLISAFGAGSAACDFFFVDDRRGVFGFTDGDVDPEGSAGRGRDLVRPRGLETDRPRVSATHEHLIFQRKHRSQALLRIRGLQGNSRSRQVPQGGRALSPAALVALADDSAILDLSASVDLATDLPRLLLLPEAFVRPRASVRERPLDGSSSSSLFSSTPFPLPLASPLSGIGGASGSTSLALPLSTRPSVGSSSSSLSLSTAFPLPLESPVTGIG